MGAGPLYLYGDSSGGTQVVETLLYLAAGKRRAAERVAAGGPAVLESYDTVEVTSAATFSAWLDFSSSFPQYDTRRSCSGPCQDISSTVFQGDPGPSRPVESLESP